MLRTALLGGNSITLDADMSKYIETVSDQGVIEGLEISSGSVAPGKAWVKATRSNRETIMVLVQNTEAFAVDAAGTKKIWLEIRQEAIDNGLLNNEDGTGIASIKTGPTLPSKNSLLLASVNNGRLTDQRAMIPKIQSVAQRTATLEGKVQTQEKKVSKLEEAAIPTYIGKIATVGESYQLGDAMFERGGVIVKRELMNERTPINESWGGTYMHIGTYNLSDSNKVRVEVKGMGVYVSSTQSAACYLVFANRYFSSEAEIKDSNNASAIYATININNINTPYSPISFDYKGPVCVSLVTIRNRTLTIKGGFKIIGIRDNTSPNLYPRNVVNVGAKVECTIAGIHSDGSYIYPQMQELQVNKLISGIASATREAPTNGILEIKWKSGDTSGYARCRINGEDLPQTTTEQTKTIFVKKGVITLETWNNGTYGTGAMISLTKFTGIM